MAQMTTVDWLVEQLPLIQQEGLRDIIEQAKQMFEEQIKKAYNDAIEAEKKADYFTIIPSAEQYYNETYGSGLQK